MLALNRVLELFEDEITSVKQISSNVVKVSFYGGKSTLCAIKLKTKFKFCGWSNWHKCANCNSVVNSSVSYHVANCFDTLCVSCGKYQDNFGG